MANTGPSSYQDPQIQIRAYSRPASSQNGDWWGWFRVGSRMAVFIADVAGREALSVSAAAEAQSVIAEFARALEAAGDAARLRPSELIRRANAAVFESGGGRVQMTFFAGVLDLDRRELVYANAGHCPPWWLAHRPGTPRQARLLASAGTRLGEAAETPAVDEHTVALASGDVFVFYTDGLIGGTDGEAIGDSERLVYGSRRPRKLMETHDSRGETALIDALMQDYAAFNGGQAPDDDLTIFTLQIQF